MSGGWISIRYFMHHRAEELAEVFLQLREAGALREGLFVHVEPLVDFDLQAVPSGARVGIRAHQLHALVRIVDLDVVAHSSQNLKDDFSKPGLARRTVAVA